MKYPAIVEKLRVARLEDKPWHELATLYLEGRLLAQKDSQFHYGRQNQQPLFGFETSVQMATGIHPDDFQRMCLTLQRVETLTKGEINIGNLLSDDLDAVETAARLAWMSYETGITALLKLREGSTTKEEIEIMIADNSKSAAAPAKTPHDHWSHMDENLEMLEFNRLQFMVRLGEKVHPEDTARLTRLAQSKGYADADSFEHSREDAASAPEDYMEGEYWQAIDRSERILGDARGAGMHRDLARGIAQDMRDAYERGYKMRSEPEAASSPSP